MEAFVLLVVLFTPGGGEVLSISMQDFDSKVACNYAADTLKYKVRGAGNDDIEATCVLKK